MTELSTYQKVEALIKNSSLEELGQIRDLIKHQILVNAKESDSFYSAYQGRTIVVSGDFKFTDYDIEDYERVFFYTPIKTWGSLAEGIEYIIFKYPVAVDAIVKQRNFQFKGHDLTAISVKEYEIFQKSK